MKFINITFGDDTQETRFTKDELESIRIDVQHVIDHVSLSDPHHDIRESVVKKIKGMHVWNK